jgi:hypothetical protein
MLPLRALALALAATFAVGVAQANGTYSYDVNLYNRYVSHGPWWTHSSMTNSTTSPLTWRVALSSRSCVELSGAVSLALEAKVATSSSSCVTRSIDMSTVVQARASAALIQRAVKHYDYYSVRKFDKHTGVTVATGYATLQDSFTDYAFAPYY